MITLSILGIVFIFCVFVLAFIGIILFGNFLMGKPPVQKRFDQLMGDMPEPVSHDELLNKLSEQFMERQAEKLSKKEEPLIDRILKKFRQENFLKPDHLKVVFAQAGWHPYDAHTLYTLTKVVLTLFFGGMGYVFFVELPNEESPLYAVGGYLMVLIAIVGWYAFDILLSAKIASRTKTIDRSLPDVLDLLVVCLQAGLSFARALERVAKEVAPFNRDMAHELATTSVELEILLDRRQALQNLAQRVPTVVIKNFVTTLSQTLQQGTPVLKTLEVIADEARLQRMQNAEIKAAKLPSLMILPLALFILPNMFIVLLGPSIVMMIKMM